MYNRSAKYYDDIYHWKNYRKESEQIRRYVQRFKKSPGKDLLDVACGTGNHIAYLKKWFNVQGLDHSQDMLKQAQRKHPEVTFTKSNMVNFSLDKKFDIVTCLFSAIGHVKNKKELRDAVRNMADHLKPGGLLVLEASFQPKRWKKHRMDANFVNEPELKIARMNISGRIGNTALLNMHHLIATSQGIEYFIEHMELQLFNHNDYLRAYRNAGLKVKYDKNGLEGRGLYLGLKPLR